MQIFSKKKKQKTSPSKDPQVKTMERRRRLEFQGKTDKGRIRKNNEDFFGFKMPEGKEKLHKYGSLFIVADGVGGSANGEVASQMAVSIITNLYYSQPEDLTPEARLQIAFDKANQTIRSKAQEMHTPEMATTATVAVVFPDRAIIANIGDSRCYVINPERTKNITQVTQDHSLVAEQVREGLITSQQAKVAKNKNVITRALGIEPRIKVDFFKLPIAPGDKILLTTDGLLRVLNDEQIYQVVQNKTVHNPVETLIELANKGGAPDNVTVCIIDFDRKVAFIKENPLATGIIALTSLCIITCLFLFLPKYFKNSESYKQLKELGKQIEQNAESTRHRLSIQSEKEITVYILKKLSKEDITKKFFNDPNFLFDDKEVKADSTENKKFLFHFLKIKKELGSQEKVPIDFEEGKEYTIQIQDINQYYYPIDIILRYQIGEDQKSFWEWVGIEGNKPDTGFDSKAILDNATKKILQIDKALFSPIILLKIDAKEAIKISLSKGSEIPFDDDKVSGVTDLIKNDNTWSLLKSATKENPVKVNLKIFYPGNQNDNREILLQYCGEENNKQTWKVDSAPNDLDVSLSNENSNLYPTLKIEKKTLSVDTPLIKPKEPSQPKQKTYEITFTVIDSGTRKSILNATIDIRGGSPTISRTGKKNKDGSVTFQDLPAGSYTYTVSHPDYQTTAKTNFTLPQTKPLEIEVLLLPKQETTTHQLGSVTFTILNSDNQPVKGSLITFQGSVSLKKSSADNGRVTFSNLPYGTYTVTVNHSQYEEKTITFTLNQPVYEHPPIMLTKKQGSVTFTIVDPSNQPVKGSLITFQGSVSLKKSSADNGRVTFSNLPYGTYTVTVNYSQYEEKTITFTLNQPVYEHPPIMLTKKVGTTSNTFSWFAKSFCHLEVSI